MKKNLHIKFQSSLKQTELKYRLLLRITHFQFMINLLPNDLKDFCSVYFEYLIFDDS